MKPHSFARSGAAASSGVAPSSSSSSAPTPSVKYEVLTFKSAQPLQPVRFEFGPAKETFTVNLPTDPNDGTTRQITWREWKRCVLEQTVVRQHFKAAAVLSPSDFALRLPAGEWIGPDSVRDNHEAETTLLLRLAGATSTTASILVLYAPHIHICTFDGIKFSASSFGHWLSASDTKTLERLRKLESDVTVCPNNFLLKDQHSTDFARLLYRIALFLKEDLGLGPEGYIISVPFGEYVYADGDDLGKDEIRARVQVTDARIFWTLLLKFEEKLNDDEDERFKRLDYFVHQRQAWIDARSLDYRRWASQEASSVKAALEALTPPLAAQVQFKLPKNFSWDEYGRMQLCLKMLSPICDMVGNMGAISLKLKNVVGGVQMAAQLTGTSAPHLPVSLNVSARNDQCLVLLPADRYMNVLTRANADPKAWGLALLEALRDAPDRLYSGLLNETSGLYQCSRDDLSKLDEAIRSLAPRPPGYKGIAKIVDTSVLPVSVDIIRALESKNNTDKRLFYERALETKTSIGLSSGTSTPSVEKSVIPAPKPTIWEKKRAAAIPPTPQASQPSPVIPPSHSDREELSSKNSDFARFDAESLNPVPSLPGVSRGPPTIGQSQVKTVLARPAPPQVLTSQERPPPPTVVSRGPPRVVIEHNETRPPPPMVIRPPPPQVKSSPPTVVAQRTEGPDNADIMPRTAQETNQYSRGRNPNVQNRRPYSTRPNQEGRQEMTQGEWRSKADTVAIPQQQEPVKSQKDETFRKDRDFNIDREDRGYDTGAPVSSGSRGGRPYRGRGRGQGRGGNQINRGGRTTSNHAHSDNGGFTDRD